MEYNVFRDYCKAENSDDEEVNHDLQSRLYAGIYYTSNYTENADKKTDIKLETSNTNENLYTNTSIAEISSLDDSFVKNDTSKSSKKACSINDSTNTAFVEKDNKPDIKSIQLVSEVELLHKDRNNKSDLNVFKEFNENIEPSKNNKQSTACHDTDYVKGNSSYSSPSNVEKDVHVKPKAEDESKEELRIMDSSNNEIITQSPHSNSTKHNIDNSNVKHQQTAHDNVNSDNILKKYDFAKSFINKLYVQKYENLEKKLYEVEEDEKEKSLRQKEQEKLNVERNQESPQINEGTKYDVTGKTENLKKSAKYSEEITLVSSETETDSEESILEVPIPPKPQPPVINLQDSDESSESSSSDSDTDHESSIVLKKKINVTKRMKKKDSVTDQDSDCSTLIIGNVNDVTEDIMLNCTAIQKGASSVKEIMQMSKDVQSVHSDKDESLYESFTNIDNISEFQSPKSIDKSNAVYERDKNKSINYAEDVMVTNFTDPKEVTPSRKRHHGNDNEPSTSMEQSRDLGIENKRCKTSIEQHNVDDNQKSWEEYIFRPISENLKNFFESKEQENFDVAELQSKMSKDPRLWAILDEDLMPGLVKRNRYWNLKCFNCFRKGHQDYNCPEPFKPLRCHMCGTQGHTEIRCPQKMCLTCGKKQGTFRKTCESCRILYCDMCSAVGHKSSECPDLWRRFHQTTQTSEINIPENLSEVMKPADLLYCCNCTKRGHDSSTCSEYQWSQHFPTPAYVSNYTGGPEYKVPEVRIDINKDVIPLSNVKKHKSMIFLKDKDDLESSCVLYSYGTFYTRHPIGEELKRKLLGDQILPTHMASLLNEHVFPAFLNQLSKLVKFELKVYYNPSKELMLRVRSTANLCRYIAEIFIFWLKLNDEDKNLDMCIHLPRDSKKLLKLLTRKLREIHLTSQDPNYICNQIEHLQKQMVTVRDPARSIYISKQILNHRSNLIKVYHAKPKNSDILKKLKKIVRRLKGSDPSQVFLGVYLNIIVVYNKMFLPRALENAELQRFLKKYYAHVNKKNKEKENKVNKKVKKNKCTFETFIRDLQKYNESMNEQKARSKTNDNDACSSKDIETQDKYPNNIQITLYNAENTSVKEHNIDYNVTESIDVVRPIDRIQLPRNQDISGNKEMTEAKQKFNSKTVSLNVTSTPQQKPIQTMRKIKNVPCAKIKPSGNNTETLNKSNKEEANTSDIQQQDNQINSEVSSSKKKKLKKAKKAKLDIQNNSEVTENEVIIIDASLKNDADQIIKEALEFNLPYMNKAVGEIQKRINENSLKQEHIDTLQRLINLEKDHRKYVSAFCNYFQ